MTPILYVLKKNLLNAKDEESKTAIKDLMRELIEAEFKTLDALSSTAQPIPQYPDANHININQHHYIAMGHPSDPFTFWKMILQEKSPLIVKLNKDNDENRYFPTQLDVTQKDLTITLLHQEAFGTINKRVFRVSDEKETGDIVHLEFTHWPDFGVPTSKELASLLLVLNSERKKVNDHDPITIHCKKGFGRTGTFIAIDSIQGKYQPNVIDVVNRIRAQRHSSMVENAKQYRLIYEFSLHSKGQ